MPDALQVWLYWAVLGAVVAFLLACALAYSGLLLYAYVLRRKREIEQKQASICTHYWEMITKPAAGWISNPKGYGTIEVTYWRERCAGCGDVRERHITGVWTLEELVGEKTYGHFQGDLEPSAHS